MSEIDLFTAFDSENIGDEYAYGLQPWRIWERKLSCRTWATATVDNGEFKTAGGIRPMRDELANVLDVMHQNGRIVVGWNLSYDIAILLAYGLTTEVFRLRYLDAQLLWKRLEPRRHAHGLKDWLRIHAPALNGYDIDFEDYFNPDTPTPSDEWVLWYNKIDAMGTLAAAVRMWSKLDRRQQISSLIEGSNLRHKGDMNLRGVPVNLQNTAVYYNVLKQQASEALGELLPHLPHGRVPNFGSPKQLRELLYDHWGLVAPFKTPTGANSTDKAALKTLALDDPRALSLLQCRESKNSIKRYVQNVVDSAAYNGAWDNHGTPAVQHLVYGAVRHTRPIYVSAAAETGRGSYNSKQGRKKQHIIQTGVALHQWKRADLCRNIICAPPGYKLCEFDASGQEVRWMAELSRDPVLLDVFKPGAEKDPHAVTGARLGGYSYDSLISTLDKEDGSEAYEAAKQKRYLGKFTNLSSQYRIGVRTMRLKALADYDLVLTYSETVHLQETYKNTYRGVVAYWKNQILLAKEQGYVATLGGRRIEFNERSWSKDTEWASGSTAINLPVQGTAADEAELALHMTSDYILNNGGMLAFLLHDALFVFFPEETAEENCRDMLRILNNLPYEQTWGYKPVINHPFDAKIGDTWGTMHKVTL